MSNTENLYERFGKNFGKGGYLKFVMLMYTAYHEALAERIQRDLSFEFFFENLPLEERHYL